MKNKTFDALLLFSLFFLSHWFFGNLYEEIVLAPNQLNASYEALLAWQGYFTITNQIYYYVPFTQISVIIIWVLFFKSEDELEKKLLKKASIFGLLSLVITVLIITQLNLKLFFGNIEQYKTQIYTLSVIWLLGNALRLYLVGSALYYTFKVYIHRKVSMEVKKESTVKNI